MTRFLFIMFLAICSISYGKVVSTLLGAKNVINSPVEEVVIYDYLDGDGKAYVVLPIALGSDLTYKCDFSDLGTSSYYIFGGYNGWGQTSPIKRRYSAALSKYGQRLGVQIGQPLRLSEFYPAMSSYYSVILYVYDGICNVNGVEYELANEGVDDIQYTQGEMTQCLFACSSYRNLGYRPSTIRLYKFQIWCEDQLLFDFEPRCRKGEDVVYDRVSKTYLPTMGDGKFTGGFIGE